MVAASIDLPFHATCGTRKEKCLHKQGIWDRPFIQLAQKMTINSEYSSGLLSYPCGLPAPTDQLTYLIRGLRGSLEWIESQVKCLLATRNFIYYLVPGNVPDLPV